MTPNNCYKSLLPCAYQAYINNDHTGCSVLLKQVIRGHFNTNESRSAYLNLLLCQAKENDLFDKSSYRTSVLSLLPQLKWPTRKISGYLEGVGAFNLALSSFACFNRKTAIELLQSILTFTELPSNLQIMASLLEIELSLQLGRINSALKQVNRLRERNFWQHSQTSHNDYLVYLECRIRHRLGDIDQTLSFAKNERLNFIHRCLVEAEYYIETGNVHNILQKLLNVQLSVQDPERCLIDNAIGCIYAFSLKNSPLAECYFRSAMASNEGSREKLTKAMIRRYCLIHNAALSQLHSGKGESAFRLFLSVLPFYQRQPRIWLRLAECCILVLQRDYNQLDSGHILEISKERFAKPRHLILSSNHVTECLSRDVNESLKSNDITWEYAAHCVQNALLLTEHIQKYAYLIPWVYAAAAFINLNLGRYSIALRFAIQLENLPQISAKHKLLAVLYKTEALLMLDKIRDAMKTLNQGISFKLTTNTSLVVVYNKILLQALSGNLRKSNLELNKFWEQKNFPDVFRVLSLGAYIYLKMGKYVEARRLIENCRFNCIYSKRFQER